jgi:hypothetical protein
MTLFAALPRGRQRYTETVRLLEAGSEVNVIRDWLGHVSLETTTRYAEVTVRMNEAGDENCASRPVLAPPHRKAHVAGRRGAPDMARVAVGAGSQHDAQCVVVDDGLVGTVPVSCWRSHGVSSHPWIHPLSPHRGHCQTMYPDVRFSSAMISPRQRRRPGLRRHGTFVYSSPSGR